MMLLKNLCSTILTLKASIWYCAILFWEQISALQCIWCSLFLRPSKYNWTLLSWKVSSRPWNSKASAFLPNKCERVNLKASQLSRNCRKSRKEWAKELEGFIISVQCFLSQFHHQAQRGILFPRSPLGVREATHTPHIRNHTCAHSYRCWQRPLHILSLHHLSVSSVLAVSLSSGNIFSHHPLFLFHTDLIPFSKRNVQ